MNSVFRTETMMMNIFEREGWYENKVAEQNHKISVYESFFNQIYMNYAVCLNQGKVKEALELIYKFCAQPNYATDEELAEKRERVIKMMEGWR